MDDKYNLRKSKEPETKQEVIQHQIEELVERRDKIANLAEKQAIQREIMKLFAQYERLKS
jgi:membrane protein insertase Oxa1/YidC/SpoIIIJ